MTQPQDKPCGRCGNPGGGAKERRDGTARTRFKRAGYADPVCLDCHQAITNANARMRYERKIGHTRAQRIATRTSGFVDYARHGLLGRTEAERAEIDARKAIIKAEYDAKPSPQEPVIMRHHRFHGGGRSSRSDG